MRRLLRLGLFKFARKKSLKISPSANFIEANKGQEAIQASLSGTDELARFSMNKKVIDESSP